MCATNFVTLSLSSTLRRDESAYLDKSICLIINELLYHIYDQMGGRTKDGVGLSW